MDQKFSQLLPAFPAHFIDNEWVRSQEMDVVENPATGQVITEVARGSTAEVQLAAESAKRAQKAWAQIPQPQRADYLKAFAQQIQQHKSLLAELLTTEQGKPLTEALAEVDMALGMLDYYASFGWKRTGHVLASGREKHQAITREQPLGVVAAIIPWNYPLALFVRKAAPALVAGNSIIIKPSEVTPLCSLALASLSLNAEIPAGVINVVLGQGAVVGDALVKHPVTQLVTMTGSTQSGKLIYKNAAEKIIPVSLELGGKAPFIVLADADMQQAAHDALASRLVNCGQVCICNERTYVQRDVYEVFLEELKKAASAVVVGDPMIASTTVGPKVSKAEQESVLTLLDKTQQEGGRVLWQAELPKAQSLQDGFWLAPAIVVDLPNDATILNEEVFGPILPVVVFDSLDEVIEQVNASEYGLSSYVYTQSLSAAMRISDQLEYGEVYINRYGPEELNGFHAGWKLSGIGGDDGEHGYQLYVKHKTIYMSY